MNMKKMMLLNAVLASANLLAINQGIAAEDQPQHRCITWMPDMAGTGSSDEQQQEDKVVTQSESSEDPTKEETNAEQVTVAETIAHNIEAKKQQTLDSSASQLLNRAGDRLLMQMSEEENPVVSGVGVALLLNAIAKGATGDSHDQITAWLGGEAGNTIQSREILQQDDNAFTQAAAMLIPVADVVLPEYQEYLTQAGFVLADDLAALNQEVSNATHGAIPQVLDELDPNARLVLTHALHFSADWQNQFDAERTAKQPFLAITGDSTAEIEVSTMQQKLKAVLIDDKDYVGLSVPFRDDYSLLLAMPKSEQLDHSVLIQAHEWLLENRPTLLNGTAQEINLLLPKWSLKQSNNLIPALQAEGVKSIFTDGQAQLTNISTKEALYVDQFKQDVQLNIDEKGGEAAVATTAVMKTRGLHVDTTPKISINRAFVYSITKQDSGMNVISGYLYYPVDEEGELHAQK